MPENPDGSLREFTAPEIAAMEIETFGVRDMSIAVETRKVDENTMTRPFFCKWEKRFDFVELVLGDSKTWQEETAPGSGVFATKLSRLVPNSVFGRHPESNQIMATRIEEIRPHGAATENIGRFPETGKALVTVFYEHRPFLVRSDAGLTTERQRYVSIGDHTQSDAEAFTLPGGNFKYTTAGGGAPHGVPVPINVSYVRPIERFTLWWEDLPFDLLASDGATYKRLYFGKKQAVGTDPDGIPFIGTVNSELVEVVSAGQIYQPGQLLLEGVERIKQRSPLAKSGYRGWKYRVGFKFAFTPRLWTDLFHYNPASPGDSGHHRVSVDGIHYATVNAIPDNRGLYNVRDHNALFDPNYS